MIRPTATLAAALAGAVVLSAPTAGAAADQPRAIDRIEGPDRIATAAAVAHRAFPGTAEEVYLARADVPADALAAGSLTAGPVLLVPRCGAVPAEVAATIERVGPDRVVALGGPAAICDTALRAAADGRTAARLAGRDRYGTAAAIARHAFPAGADVVYVASGVSTTDGVVAGALTAGPVLLVPPAGDLPAAVADAIAALDPREVVAVGGAAAVAEGILDAAADGRPTRRLAGASRTGTAAAVAAAAFPDGAPTVYLARDDDPADALVAGTLTDGPVLPVPSCGAVPAAIQAAVGSLGPDTVTALGGHRAICDITRDRAAGRPAPSPPTSVLADPRDLAAAIRVSEEVLRTDPARAWIDALGALQQVSYRVLVARPELRDPTLARLPAPLRPVAAANVAAGAELRAMLTDLRDEPPPDWRIVPPAPPDELLGYYREAEARSGVPWQYLAAINLVETRMGRIVGDSTAGAQGPMQFMPATWEEYGEGDVHDDRDAILAAGRYLRAHGAPHDMWRALYAYNHDDRYVAAVTRYAQQIGASEAVYRGYHAWQVWYLTTSGDVLLPEGWAGRDAD